LSSTRKYPDLHCCDEKGERCSPFFACLIRNKNEKQTPININ